MIGSMGDMAMATSGKETPPLTVKMIRKIMDDMKLPPVPKFNMSIKPVDTDSLRVALTGSNVKLPKIPVVYGRDFAYADSIGVRAPAPKKKWSALRDPMIKNLMGDLQPPLPYFDGVIKDVKLSIAGINQVFDFPRVNLKAIMTGESTMNGSDYLPRNRMGDVAHRNWDYEVAHPDMVCPDEIYKYISRADPVVIAKTGTKIITYHVHNDSGKPEILNDKPTDGRKFSVHSTISYKKRNLVFVHSSLIDKATILGMTIPEWASKTTQDTVYGGYTYDNLRVVTAWAKEVKGAKWEDHAERLSVRVIIPKI